jgi:uncharacterized protein YjbI with pentapeptide repeats
MKWRDWTSFGEDLVHTETLEKDKKGNVTKIIDTKKPEPSKELWDFLGLFGSIATPILLAYLSYQIQQKEQSSNRENLLEDVLQKYLDDISKLILENSLTDENNNNPARDLARTKTLIVLGRLKKDIERKLIILHFLYDSKLINIPQKIDLEDCDFSSISDLKIDLKKADFTRVNFKSSNLTGADLTDANLKGANLEAIDFTGATLKGVNFEGANLKEAILSTAKLSNANFTEANLRKTDFRGVEDISPAQIKNGRNWEKAVYDQTFLAKLGKTGN